MTGIAYLVQDNYWYGLSLPVRNATYWGFHQAFTQGKTRFMTLKGVNAKQVPKQINFVDAVIQVYDDVKPATKGLLENVNKQLVQIQDYNISIPKYMNETIDIGRAFTLKEILKDTKGNKVGAICITDAAVSLNGVIGWWSYLTREERKVRGEIIKGSLKEYIYKLGNYGADWINHSPEEWQKWFGVSLGRILAHEVWHQLWSQDSSINTKKKKESYGADHIDGSFDLEGQQAGTHWHKKERHYGFGSSGWNWILGTLQKLSRVQDKLKTYPIDRR